MSITRKVAIGILTTIWLLAGCKTIKLESSVEVKKAPSLPVGIYEMGYATDGKIIFSIGGNTFLGYLKQPVGEIYLYSPFGGEWQRGRFTDKPIIKGPASSVYIPATNSIISTGFIDLQRGDYYTFPLEVLDLNTYRINYVRTNPHWAHGSGAVEWNNKMYSFGGVVFEEDGSSRYSSRLVSYDPVTGEWEDHKPMPTARMTYGVVVGNSLYTIGGFDGENHYADVFRYDFEANFWELIGYLPYPVSYFSITSKYPYVFLTTIGNKKNIIGRIDIRDGSFSEFATWLTVTTPGSAIIGDKLYIFGGSWDDGKTASNKTFSIDLTELMIEK